MEKYKFECNQTSFISTCLRNSQLQIEFSCESQFNIDHVPVTKRMFNDGQGAGETDKDCMQ